MRTVFRGKTSISSAPPVRKTRGSTHSRIRGGQDPFKSEPSVEPEINECPKCRAEIFQGAVFCMQCGNRLEGRAPQPSNVRIKATPQPAKGRPVTDTAYSVKTDTGYSVTTRRANGR
jgi:hypothetical protein